MVRKVEADFISMDADELGAVVGGLDLLDRLADGGGFLEAQVLGKIRLAGGEVCGDALKFGNDSSWRCAP